MSINSQIIRELAKQGGFQLVGFAKAEILKAEHDNLLSWLDQKYHAGMQYMERNTDKRSDIRKILPSVKSVISLGMNYYTKNITENKKPGYKISRYAWGKDYHIVIQERIKFICEEIKKKDPEAELIYYVDTGPVMDKVWAKKAGLGWMGKHSNIINRKIGSWFFIASILVNRELEYSEEVGDLCGSCTRCIDACPTNAIVSDQVIDSNKCISYLTIENKGEIRWEFKGKMEDYIFGCDICQDVCPWNIKFSTLSGIEEFKPVNGNDKITFDEVNEMDITEFNRRFSESPIKRAKFSGLMRTAIFLSNNQ